MRVNVKRNHEIYLDGMEGNECVAFGLMSVTVGAVKVNYHIHEDGKCDGTTINCKKATRVIAV